MSSSRARNHQDLVWEAQHFKHSHRRYVKHFMIRSYHSKTRWRQLMRECHMNFFSYLCLYDTRIKSTPRGKWSDDNE